jgi:hypothetical protein
MYLRQASNSESSCLSLMSVKNILIDKHFLMIQKSCKTFPPKNLIYSFLLIFENKNETELFKMKKPNKPQDRKADQDPCHFLFQIST